MSGAQSGARCGWVPPTDALYCAYHDREWGVPERDGDALWAKLVLDGFQAGLSWITILRKRDAFLKAFDNFDPAKVARYSPARVEKLLADPGIIRSRAKIEAAIHGAHLYCDMRERGEDFSAHLWSFVGGKPIVNAWTTYKQMPAQTAESQAMAKDLKARGFKFCGPVIVYAFMQAVGMVNDHEITCPRHKAVQRKVR